MELCLGPRLSSTPPSNKSKTLYNHVTIHILVTATKKERAFEFWSHYRYHVLLPGTLLEVIQISNHCYGKKKQCAKMLLL